MTPRKKLLKKSRLYIILDQQAAAGKPLEKLACALIRAGAGIVQLRDKRAGLRELVEEAGMLARIFAAGATLFIINDRADIARIVGADGVHLGQYDGSIALARRILGPDKIIGRSCHSLKQSLDAQREGADYIGIGPVYATPTKPEYKPIGVETIARVREKVRIPFFAIGDINLKNVAAVREAGARRIAVCRAVLHAPDTAGAVRAFYKVITTKDNTWSDTVADKLPTIGKR